MRSCRPGGERDGPRPDDWETAKQRRRAAERAERAAAGEQSLFEVDLVPGEEDALLAAEPVSPDDALVAALLGSETFAAQVQLLARKPPLDRVEKALHALLDAGGTLPVTALAQRIGLKPLSRADGFAAVLRQLLNYDGVQVLETLPDGRTLKLNLPLLRDQFDLPR